MFLLLPCTCTDDFDIAPLTASCSLSCRTPTQIHITIVAQHGFVPVSAPFHGLCFISLHGCSCCWDTVPNPAACSVIRPGSHQQAQAPHSLGHLSRLIKWATPFPPGNEPARSRGPPSYIGQCCKGCWAVKRLEEPHKEPADIPNNVSLKDGQQNDCKNVGK